MTEKQKYISNKIRTVHKDGVRGKSVPNRQAVAIATSYARKAGYR